MSNSNYKKNKNLVASQINQLNLSGDGRIYGKTYTKDLQVLGNTTSDDLIVSNKITTPTIVTAKLEAYNPNATQQSDYVIDTSHHALKNVSKLDVNVLNATSLGSNLDGAGNNIESIGTLNSQKSFTQTLEATTSIQTPVLYAEQLGRDVDVDQHEITNISKLNGNDTDDFEIRNLSLIDGKSQTNPNGRKINITGGTAMEFGSSLCIENNEITPTNFDNFKTGSYSPNDYIMVNGSIDMQRKNFTLEVGGDITTYHGTIKTNKIDSVASGSIIDFNNTTLDNVNKLNINEINKNTGSVIKINDDLDLQGAGGGKDIKNVNTISTFNINIDGDKFDPKEYEKVEGYSFSTVNVQPEDWITLAKCSDGTDKDDLRADALFVIEDRLGSRHQCITFRAGGKFSSGHYINILQNSYYTTGRFQKLRIAYSKNSGDTYSGFLIQVQVDSNQSSVSTSTVKLRVYQNKNSTGWYSPRYVPPPSSGQGGQGIQINIPDPKFPETSVVSPLAENEPVGYMTDTSTDTNGNPYVTLFNEKYPHFLYSSELNNLIDNQRTLISFTSPVEALTSMYTPKASVTNLLRYDSNQPLNVGTTTTSPTGTEYIKANEPIVFKNNTNLNNTVSYLNSMSTNTKEGAVIYSRAVSSTTQNSDTFLNEFVVGGGDRTPVYMSTPTKYRMYAILNTRSTPLPDPGDDIHIFDTCVFYLTMPDLTYYDSSYSYGNIASFSNMTFGGDGFCDRILVHPVKHRVLLSGVSSGDRTCSFEIWGINETKGGLSNVISETQTENAVKFFSNTISSSATNSFHNVPFNRDGTTLYETKPKMYKSSQRLKIYKDDNYYFVPVARNKGVVTLTLTYSNFTAGTETFTYPHSTFMIDVLANIHCDV